MSLRTAAAGPVPVSYFEDRSLGKEGDLQNRMMEPGAPAFERGDEIAERILGALESAEQEDGIRISADVFSNTVQFLVNLPREFPLPRVVVESEQQIGLDWDEGSRSVVSVTVGLAPTSVGFSALFGREPMFGRLEIAQGTPDTLRFLLARLYPKKRTKT